VSPTVKPLVLLGGVVLSSSLEQAINNNVKIKSDKRLNGFIFKVIRITSKVGFFSFNKKIDVAKN
jgi:hypothetical protein